MTSLTQEERDYLNSLLAEQAPRPKRAGCGHTLVEMLSWGALFVVGMFIVLLVAPQLIPLDAPQPSNNPLPTTGALQRPPVPVLQPPAPLPACRDVRDTRTACIPDAQPAASDAELSGNDPTPAPPATPGITGSFWTAEEQAQFRATEEAFYDPATLPTAPPEFVETVKQGCNDPEKLEQSALLRTWCGVGDE